MFFFKDSSYQTQDEYDWRLLHEWDEDAQATDPTSSFTDHTLMNLPTVGTYTIEAGEEHRPEYLAYKLLGTASLWWILLMYNRMTNPREIKSGTVLKYPSLPALNDLSTDINIRSIVPVVNFIDVEVVNNDIDVTFNLEDGAYLSGYYSIAVDSEGKVVMPTIYYMSEEPTVVDFDNVENWPTAVWSQQGDFVATATTTSKFFQKVYIVVPEDELNRISISNIQSDIGGGWNITTRDIDTGSGLSRYVVYESVNANLGEVTWVINATYHGDPDDQS